MVFNSYIKSYCLGFFCPSQVFMANLSLSSSSGFCFADFGFVVDLFNIFCVLGGWNLFFCTVLVLPCKSVCTEFCVMFWLFLCSKELFHVFFLPDHQNSSHRKHAAGAFLDFLSVRILKLCSMYFDFQKIERKK